MPSKDSKVVSARIPNEITFKVPVSKILSSVYRLFEEGKIGLTDDGIVLKGLPQEPRGILQNDCDGCPYMENTLDTSKFDEVCEFKGLDRQKALDRCVQMMWR